MLFGFMFKVIFSLNHRFFKNVFLIICVITFLDSNNEPNVSYIISIDKKFQLVGTLDWLFVSPINSIS